MTDRSFEHIFDAWFLELPGNQVPSTRVPRLEAYGELFAAFREAGFKFTDFTLRRKEYVVKRSVPQGHYPSGKKATWMRMCMEDINSVLNVTFPPDEIVPAAPAAPAYEPSHDCPNNSPTPIEQCGHPDCNPAPEEEKPAPVVEKKKKSEPPKPEPLLEQASPGVKLIDEDMEIILGYKRK